MADPATESNAAWAEQFSGGARSTNFAKRRHDYDRTQYAKELEFEREAAMRERIVNQRDAQAFYFKSKELELREAEAGARLQERAQKMQIAEELAPLNREVRQRQIDLARTRELVAANGEMRKMEAEKRELEDADKLSTHIETMKLHGYMPGSLEYKHAVEEGLKSFRFAPKEMHDDLLKQAALSAEHLPATVEKSTLTMPSEIPGEPPVVTTKTAVSQKISPAKLEASTPLAPGEFLKKLGLVK